MKKQILKLLEKCEVLPTPEVLCRLAAMMARPRVMTQDQAIEAAARLWFKVVEYLNFERARRGLKPLTSTPSPTP